MLADQLFRELVHRFTAGPAVRRDQVCRSASSSGCVARRLSSQHIDACSGGYPADCAQPAAPLSSTIPPRAVLIRIAFGFIRAKLRRADQQAGFRGQRQCRPTDARSAASWNASRPGRTRSQPCVRQRSPHAECGSDFGQPLPMPPPMIVVALPAKSCSGGSVR